MVDYISHTSFDLNVKQYEAIKHIDGSLLILAGAGTGKTKTLVARIAYILQNGIAEYDEILAVTFTNKAANEIRERIIKETGKSIKWLGTFHSIATKILRVEAEKIGFSNKFSIIESDDQIKLLSKISDAKYLSLDKKDISKSLSIIQAWKNEGLLPEECEVVASKKNRLVNIAYMLYQDYQNQLKSMNLMDFGDLMLYSYIILKNYTEIRERYQQKIRYVMVDEYQDINNVQYEWLKLLTNPETNNICCVGDDDQSIYGWRGAQISNILKFPNEFSNTRIIKLEQNYRSTGHILSAASSLISNNRERYEKVLWTEHNIGEKIFIMQFNDSKSETEAIVAYIKTNSAPENYGENAILVRSMRQTRIFEEYCMRFNVKYRIVSGFKFYDRKEIKDLVSYLKVINNPCDNLSLERAINNPKRGIGDKSLEKLYISSEVENSSLYFKIKKLIEINALKNKKIEYFICQLENWMSVKDTLNPKLLMETIIKDISYIDYIKEKEEAKYDEKVENIQELLNVLNERDSLSDFLNDIMLETDKAFTDSSCDFINIMTMHAAKGLEFETVFLPCWEEGSFPSYLSISEDMCEEERRLAYVAMTRAKKKLFITCAERRLVNNAWRDFEHSRFIDEISNKHTQKEVGSLYNMLHK